MSIQKERRQDMKKVIKAWLEKEASWWQFWLPKSGVVGGAIAGLIILIVLPRVFL